VKTEVICVIACGCLPPVLGIGAGGVAPSRHWDPGYYHRKNEYFT